MDKSDIITVFFHALVALLYWVYQRMDKKEIETWKECYWATKENNDKLLELVMRRALIEALEKEDYEEAKLAQDIINQIHGKG